MNRKLGRAWMFTKKAVAAFFDGIAEGIENVAEIRASTTPIMHAGDTPWSDEVFVIDANVAKEIKWMSADQLRAMFNGRKVKMSSDPEVWKAMKWMSADQIRAIFGNGGFNK